MRLHLTALMIVALGLIPGWLQAQDAPRMQWPQWRGPLATGEAPNANPPLTWSEQENIKWKVEIPGEGSSTPIIHNNRIYLLTAIKTDRVGENTVPAEEQPMRSFGIVFPTNIYQFVVLCLDRETGKVLWQQVAREEVPHEGVHPDNDYASASPVTDGQRLYVSFGSRGVYAYDFDGNKLWERQITRLQTRNSFGEGSSPSVHDGVLVTVWDQQEGSFIEALDAATGQTLWKKERDEVTSWATPLIVERAGKAQAIVSASNRVRSYELKTGELLWECGGQVGNVIPAPVADQERVYCMSGFRGAALYALPFDQTGDLTDSDKIAWSMKQGTPYVPSPLLYGGRLYFNQSNNGILTVVEAATGKVLIERTRLPGIASIYASPVGAAGRVYLTSRDGATLVIKHGVDEVEVLAQNKLDEAFDASMAIVDDEIFLRGKRYLYCIE